MSQYFPTPPSDYKNIKVEIDLSNYATKKEINDITHVDTSNFALKTNLANLKPQVDKLDIGKLTTVPVVEIDLSNYATKKEINDITHVDTSNFALKTNLANLKPQVDKLDIGKLTTVPVDLSKLSNVGKMMLLKRLCMVN